MENLSYSLSQKELCTNVYNNNKKWLDIQTGW